MAKTGLNQIYDGTTWRTVEPWIYYGGQWHRAITCLYTTADGWIEFTSTSAPDTPDDTEVPWILYDYTTSTVADGMITEGDIIWACGSHLAEKFPTMIKDGVMLSSCSWGGSSAHFYFVAYNNQDDTLRGNHIVTRATVTIPSTAKKLNIEYHKQASSHVYGYVGIGLISPDATNSFDYAFGKESYPTELTTAIDGVSQQEPILSLDLPDEVKGTSNYSIVVNFWAKSHSSYTDDCQLYLDKIWFSE